MSFKAVIFDLDGTLLNTLDDLADAMNAVLRSNRLPEHEAAKYKYFVGDGIDMLVRRALPFEVADEAFVTRLIADMRREYAARRTLKTRPYPGVPAMLSAFGQAGYAMAVLTNKPDDAVEPILSALLPSCGFRIVQGAMPGRSKKPDPAIAIEIADRLGVPPREVVFMGDTAVDMATARAAGMYPIGVLWGFRTAEELIGAGARLLVHEPEDILPWIRPA
jgi:phosphoglycolate phosphatase